MDDMFDIETVDNEYLTETEFVSIVESQIGSDTVPQSEIVWAYRSGMTVYETVGQLDRPTMGF